ncbi:MAG: class I SAM-dependent methyltransferase [Paraburkholderia sp.]|uniref:class I SAM-dependent methyltransferase n=1 Tax=Burkholderiaceae TaxID=119060 RepID=UPI0020183965|nr:class I SAM-dependent methyltransferase [Burkholderia sp. 4M9327F10]
MMTLGTHREDMGNQFRSLAKRFVVRIPPIKALLDSRQTLLDERDDVVAERRHLEEAYGALETSHKRLEEEITRLKDEIQKGHDRLSLFGPDRPHVPNGHFYSPVPSQVELRSDEDRIFVPFPRILPGIDLRENEQLNLLDAFATMYHDLPFTEKKQKEFRYYYDNSAYSYTDAIFLNSMIRHVKPKRIVEVGSGFSSCMTLDTNEIWFNNSIDCTFIEPYPKLLNSLIKDEDKGRIRVLESRVQDVDLDCIRALERDDILFIDSTHVSKIGSDVNRIVFEILPLLTSGVYVHFHDIFYPFEYPKEWAFEGRAWNEAYILHAFLQHNSEFEIVAFNRFLLHFHRDFFERKMPLCLKNLGANIWLRRK